MRRVRYVVATSLDGYIAGPKGEADWIINDPEVDFAALFAEFDTFLVGRRTFEAMLAAGGGGTAGVETYVFSRTLNQQDHPHVRIVSSDAARVVADLKTRPGKDIWLFGGGSLFRSLLEAGVVDTVEVAIIPVLLGGGIAFLPAPAPTTSLTLASHRIYPTGIVALGYTVK